MAYGASEEEAAQKGKSIVLHVLADMVESGAEGPHTDSGLRKRTRESVGPENFVVAESPEAAARLREEQGVVAGFAQGD
jgi:hypothetical protein